MNRNSKKSLCDEPILSSQKDGGEHANKAASFAKTLKEQEILFNELCGFEEKLEAEYKALLS